uniref:M48 family metalloprotease n=1 Tax=Flavobacterium sp. TaxID=239 RepID=UPI00404B86D1
MRQLVLILILCVGQKIYSQDIFIIDTLDLKFKTEFIALYQSRVTKQKEAFDKLISDKKIKKEVETNYTELSDNFIKSINKGFIFQHDAYDSFLDEILQKIIENNSEFSSIKKTKILVSFGRSPNAYAIGNEIIVMFVPLFKNITNEYELSFIICHEIAHNLLTHSYNGLIDYAKMMHSTEIKNKTQEIKKNKYNKGEIASSLYKDIVYGKRRNNRQLEHQADSLGFVLFRNTFKGKEYLALKSLETLDEIDREKDSLVKSDYFKIFNSDKVTFKNEWIENDELSAYKYNKSNYFWAVDSLKTHPDCDLRVGFVKKHFTIKPIDVDPPSASFQVIKKSSNYNHILGLYVIEEYGKSLYETLLLLKDDEENEFLNNMVYQNLLKLEAAQKTYTLNKHLDIISPQNSESYNTFLFFFRALRKSELNAIITSFKPTP